MKHILELMNHFEKRNNISINLRLESDGSGAVNEFWNKEELIEFDDLDELEEFFMNTKYKLAEDGRCISPVQNMKTTIWFQMTPKSEAEKVIFNGEPTHNEIDEYFENACGGVYKWWI